ncbi:hypothetical protein CPB83DRAFT_798192 [Crepidotus variabilis]|uniref:Rieske domain-containing protein n=1 Tax=Crepidotus variabilis TaxID=179855 RepID=A0A9P6JKV2_9AGAR|nr:hypothetical protein CPB83DRAFT_798192 [Crepidotus variabilis]
MEYLEIAPLSQLLTHFRYHLNLRSQEGLYHALIIFRLSADTENTNIPSEQTPENIGEKQVSTEILSEDNGLVATHRQIYAMEASCPHLGADMSHAEIEECETSVIAVCPWHRYDFDLKTGESETGLRACTYAVEVRMDTERKMEKVFLESPKRGSSWQVVELRPVSEEFADPPPKTAPVLPVVPSAEPREPEPVVPDNGAPTTLIQWAVLILNTPNPILKVERTRHAVHQFRIGKLKAIGHKSSNTPSPPDVPPREASWTSNSVAPYKVKNNKNRASMLHALANIEQWAIDLAWDIIARFGPKHPDLPHAFFSDFSKMALDESKHFSLLTSRLAAISPSTPYGSMPVHASLWESAIVTSDSFRARLAIIHLVHEARGLDVNPATIQRFRKAGDHETVDVMEIIHADEVTHVTSGHRWFTWICVQQGGVDPVATFREEVKKGWKGDIKGPFNVEARERAGLTPHFYEDLRGELGDQEKANYQAPDKQVSVNIGYDL